MNVPDFLKDCRRVVVSANCHVSDLDVSENLLSASCRVGQLSVGEFS